jgi:hypothetical protein
MPKSKEYLVCPACGRRTVLFHIGRMEDDFYQCFRRDCTEDGRWKCHPKGTGSLDRANMIRLRNANPERAKDL